MVTGIFSAAPPPEGVTVIAPFWVVVNPRAFVNTVRVAGPGLVPTALTWEFPTDTNSQLFAGLTEIVYGSGVMLEVLSATVVATLWLGKVVSETELGLEDITGPLPPPPEPGVKVTPILTSVPPPAAEVGCRTMDPLQVLFPLEQMVFDTDTVKMAGAISDVPLRRKKEPLGVSVKGPEPETAT
jgi:hypothetical protein